MALLKDQCIIALNSGSSSLKLSLFTIGNRGELQRLADGQIKELSAKIPRLELRGQGRREERSLSALSLDEAMKLLSDAVALFSGKSELSVAAVGHRVVHGGEHYRNSVLLNDHVLQELDSVSSLAPLHNPHAIRGIKASLRYFGDSAVQVAVFDTAFYSDMPEVAIRYAIDYQLAEKYAIRRYGFHGISHAFLWEIYAKTVGDKAEKSKIVTLHLGNGCSATAILGGRPLDTSMGFTPLEGLVMGTRSGDLDPSIVELIVRNEDKTAREVLQMLNLSSGLLGLSGLSSNMEELLASSKTDERARFACDLFCYRIAKYIGSYIAALGGLDAILFSGGIGENSWQIRAQIAEAMRWYGVRIDVGRNERAVGLQAGQVESIAVSDSAVALYVVGADENRYIAEQALLLSKTENQI